MSNCHISALYVRKDSVYKSLGLDCWDEQRDARNFVGSNPVIAHPPCRAWGRLWYFSKHPESEKFLATSAVELVRKNGGVLEHPAGSKLWAEMCMPSPGELDSFGGFTLSINQSWFGHRAKKNTWLYIVGISPFQLPSVLVNLSFVSFKIGQKPGVSKAEREHTPVALAHWLVSICNLISNESQQSV